MVNWRRLRLSIQIDWTLLLLLTAVCAYGLTVLYSASGQNAQMVTSQSIKMAIGALCLLLLAQVKPEQLAAVSVWLYVLGVILLILVDLFGSGRGTQRWLEVPGLGLRFQPAEIMKIAVPLLCAKILAGAALPPTWSRLLLSAAVILLPTVLIAMQPDLGTAVLVFFAGITVVFLAGLPARLMLISAVLLLASLYPLWNLMYDYQRERVLTLLDPTRDTLGAGYHIIQSVIAIGSGGFSGKGWLQGTQSQLEFIPERHTDFIFAVLCEEWGLVGAVVLLVLYALIISRAAAIAIAARSSFGRLVAASLAITFFFYVLVNISMVAGVLPVVGVPLPFISWGGTAIVTLMVGFGMIMAVHGDTARLRKERRWRY